MANTKTDDKAVVAIRTIARLLVEQAEDDLSATS
jgi:hypothetical protein